nr:retrotransposon protein, putative, Ty1-copia subclass [Tanacetum cinerariifolium]
EDKGNYLEHPIPAAPVAASGQQVPPQALAAHTAWELKTMFAQLAEQELLQTVREFYACKLEEGQSTLPKKDAVHALHAIKERRVQKNQKKKSHKVVKGNQGEGKGLRGSRKLKPEALSVYVGECHRVAAKAIVFRNNLVYFSAIPRDDIYEIDLSSSNKNDSSIHSSLHDESNYCPKSFWDYAIESVARILNMVPTKKVDKTPYEIWHGQTPKLSYLKVWCCEALVKRDTFIKPDKLDPRSFRCIFVGYPKETMGYSFYSQSENKVFVAQNVEFF